MIVKKYKINTKKLELKNNVNTKLNYSTNSINKNIQVNVIAKQVIDLTDSMVAEVIKRNTMYVLGTSVYSTAPCGGYYMGWMFYPYGIENDIEVVFTIVNSSIGQVGLAIDLEGRRSEAIYIIDVPLKKGMTISCSWYNSKGTNYCLPGVGVGIYTGEIPSSFKTLNVRPNTGRHIVSSCVTLDYTGSTFTARYIDNNTYCSNKQQMFKKYGLIT